MSLKTYDRHYTNGTLVGAKAPDVREPMPWPFNVIDDDGVLVIDSWTEIAPGKWVTHTSQGGKGMVVAVNDEQLTILWSDEPRGLGDFSNIAMPLVRRVFAPQIANQLVSIQPMSLPSASIFYMDYTFGDDLDRKCTQGPWWSRIYWKTRRWLRSLKKIGAPWSRLRSLLPSRSTPKSTNVEPACPTKWARGQVTPDQTKAIVDEWVNRNAAKARGSGIQGR